jgi:hypothetical protein
MSLPSACSELLASSSSFSNRLICCSTCLRVAVDEEPLDDDDLVVLRRDELDREAVERERVAGFFAAGIAITSPSSCGLEAREALRNGRTLVAPTLHAFDTSRAPLHSCRERMQ